MTTATPRPTATPAPAVPAVDETVIRPEIKEYLDSYEAFVDEYVVFMQTYENADMSSMLSMMDRYFDLLDQLLEFEAAIESMDEDDMTTAELNYYLEVTSRVSRKLLNAVG